MTKEGYIKDFISDLEVKATPEEVEAVQVFAKQLVEDYGYPKSYIQTRPQWRVKVRPSDTKKSYPVDIAAFTSEKHTEDTIFLIVECKKKTRRDGKTQLQDYLRFSKAQLGVWFNGKERLFLRKIEKAGRVEFKEIPNIPKFGQSIDDIGALKRRDLKPTHNLRAIFRAIRNHLAANAVGTTRDEILAQQLINLIFCKIYDEKFRKPDDIVEFRVGIDEDSKKVENRIKELFKGVKTKYKEVFEESDTIKLDPKSIAYVVGELQNYCLLEAERDVVADAFETFIGPSLKGAQGQFFTPRNVVKMMVDILDPDENDLIIDPACGSGGFLIESLKHIWTKLDAKAKEYGWNERELKKEKMEASFNNIRGIEKDKKPDHIKNLGDLCGLNNVMHMTVDELSKGYRQRVGIAHALMGDPEILVLDEPTAGLDPNQIVETREIIKRIGREKTIIYSTHILSEAEATCDRIVIINKGKIVADDTLDGLRKSMKEESFENIFMKLTKGN